MQNGQRFRPPSDERDFRKRLVDFVRRAQRSQHFKYRFDADAGGKKHQIDFAMEKFFSERQGLMVFAKGDFLQGRRHQSLGAALLKERGHLPVSAAFKRNDAEAGHSSFYK